MLLQRDTQRSSSARPSAPLVRPVAVASAPTELLRSPVPRNDGLAPLLARAVHERAWAVETGAFRPARDVTAEAQAHSVAASVDASAGVAPVVNGHLAGELQDALAPALGDTSHLKIHSDALAAALTASIGARAFAAEQDIYLGAGELARPSDAGALLAHEATHAALHPTGVAADGTVLVHALLKDIKPSDLDKHISTSETVKGAFGKGSESTKAFAAIRDALSDYRSAARKGKSDLAAQAQQLDDLDDLCTRFVKQHGTDKRRAIIDRLFDAINLERKAVSQLQAEEIYQGNVVSGRKPVAATETDPAKKFAFQALTATGQMGATNLKAVIDTPGATGPGRDERIKSAQRKYGLTEAEVSAITIFSAGDFSYINPVTVNSASWLAEQKQASQETWAKLNDDKIIKEEGSLHTAVALQGLRKMEAFKGEVYRGARFTPKEVKDKLAPGKTMSYGSLTSSTKDEDVALNFVYGLSSGGKIDQSKSAAVIYIITDSGGRDISDIALVRHEAEVLILPGSVFEVKSLQELDATAENAKHADKVQKAKDGGKPLPKSWYEVRLVPSKKPATIAPKQPPTAPWQRVAAGPAGDPFALPRDVGILGQDRRRPERALPANRGTRPLTRGAIHEQLLKG